MSTFRRVWYEPDYANGCESGSVVIAKRWFNKNKDIIKCFSLKEDLTKFYELFRMTLDENEDRMFQQVLYVFVHELSLCRVNGKYIIWNAYQFNENKFGNSIQNEKKYLYSNIVKHNIQQQSSRPQTKEDGSSISTRGDNMSNDSTVLPGIFRRGVKVINLKSNNMGIIIKYNNNDTYDLVENNGILNNISKYDLIKYSKKIHVNNFNYDNTLIEVLNSENNELKQGYKLQNKILKDIISHFDTCISQFSCYKNLLEKSYCILTNLKINDNNQIKMDLPKPIDIANLITNLHFNKNSYINDDLIEAIDLYRMLIEIILKNENFKSKIWNQNIQQLQKRYTNTPLSDKKKDFIYNYGDLGYDKDYLVKIINNYYL